MSWDSVREEIKMWQGMDPDSRLRAILNDRVMRFDPYGVDDETLLMCAERGFWRGGAALTQMAVFHFHDIREVKWKVNYDALFFHIGECEEELSIPVNSLVNSVTHHITKHPVYSTINGRHIVRSNIEALQHKSVFVSHSIHGFIRIYRAGQAYRMHSLHGRPGRRAATIRKAMIQARIEMLGEVLAYPESSHYIGGIPSSIDYRLPLREAIARLRHIQSSVL